MKRESSVTGGDVYLSDGKLLVANWWRSNQMVSCVSQLSTWNPVKDAGMVAATGGAVECH